MNILSHSSITHSDIWFNDGNIVLIAGSFAFKVHQGQLRRHSEFFDGMFDIPQPSEPDMLDGCPSIIMPDDPDDLYHFLSALYDGMYLSFPRPVHFACLASVLRLSTKYLVPHLRQQCLERLTSDWPCTLQDWDAREKEASVGPQGLYSPRQYTPNPILIIELALELGLTQLLPSAFYDLSRYSPSKIMYGTPGIKSVLVSPDTVPRYVCLSGQLLVRAFQGRESAQQFLVDFLSSRLEHRQPSSECLYHHPPVPPPLTKSHPCMQAFLQVFMDIFRCIGGVAIGRDADPLFTLAQGMDRLTKPGVAEGELARTLMCTPCKLQLLDDFARGREAAWMCMPGWFGLADEDDLMNGWGGKNGMIEDDDRSD